MKPEDFLTKKTVLLDTCLIVHELLGQREKKLLRFCEENNVLITSFNVEELQKVTKKLGHEKKKIKHFLEQAKITIIDVPVSLGETKKEKKYADETNKELLKKIRDPSDAILVAAAIKSASDIITRDKHHLFTMTLEEEIKEYGLAVYNDISKYEQN